ncbi:DUF1127 domain-containing protein [Tateyamaria sp. SN3-11]|uniref:DUF1127 domain-containing protein n=1 Tax=Tateyamaria sp. SN3-11 TaxID=3092147 RepID=UPI0039ED0E86
MAATDYTTRTTRMAAPAAPRFSLWTMIAVWRSRRALAHLDARALDDIGVNRDRAAAEAAKPIWDVPSTWRL